MNARQVLKKTTARRRDEYRPRKHDFTMDVSFSRKPTNATLVLVQTLIEHMSVAQVAKVLGYTKYMVAKLNRVARSSL